MQSQFRVLYAEDNKDACLMLQTLFGLSNIEVKTANTIAEAWSLAQTEQFDLYLLDIQFPEGSGLSLCRQLREFAPRKPIFFYSGNARDVDKAEGIAAGADAFMVKPHSDILLSIVEQLVAEPKQNAREAVKVLVRLPSE